MHRLNLFKCMEILNIEHSGSKLPYNEKCISITCQIRIENINNFPLGLEPMENASSQCKIVDVAIFHKI